MLVTRHKFTSKDFLKWLAPACSAPVSQLFCFKQQAIETQQWQYKKSPKDKLPEKSSSCSLKWQYLSLKLCGLFFTLKGTSLRVTFAFKRRMMKVKKDKPVKNYVQKNIFPLWKNCKYFGFLLIILLIWHFYFKFLYLHCIYASWLCQVITSDSD